ncbi:MAG: hypothetical protein M5U28_40255 [Sandaracinaceae bacterium]|nr:hypothetical protein [Sandaracinaceae bacterium]
MSSEEALGRRLAAMRAGDEVATTLHPLELRVVRESEDEVELVDFGWTGDGAHRTGTVFHRKRVVLRSVEGRWLVTVEAPLDERRCELPPLDREPPLLWTELRRQYATLVENCEPPGSEDDESYPGIGGSIGCDPSSWSIDARRFCPAGPERSGCVAKARREIEAFGFEAEAHDDEDR